ncbi:MAG: FHA domain-containing protein, partial [Acidobacteriaceae bacterium]
MTEQNETILLKTTQIAITWPDGSKETFPIGEVTHIGRGKENTISVPDEYRSISRRHVELYRKEEGYFLRDLDSQHGILVNGIKVKEIRLKDGDEIKIGIKELGQEIRIVFQSGSDSMLSKLTADARATKQVPTNLTSVEPVNLPYLSIRWPNGTTNYFPIRQDRVMIGRDREASLRVPEVFAFVSGRHAEIEKSGKSFFVRDLNSTNGTYLNNQRLTANVSTPLSDNAILRFGDDTLGVSIGITFHDPSKQLEGFQSSGFTIIPDIHTLIIGRADECDIRLDHPEVSRQHARIQQLDRKYWLADLNSTNGTYVNGKQIKQTELKEGDLIQIAHYLLIFESGQLRQFESTGMRLDIQGLNQEVNTRKGKLRILDDINMSILPREFVAIVGGSGAGKTTLLNALIGYRPGQGKVQLNGQDFYAEYERYRSQLGFVP